MTATRALTHSHTLSAAPHDAHIPTRCVLLLVMLAAACRFGALAPTVTPVPAPTATPSAAPVHTAAPAITAEEQIEAVVAAMQQAVRDRDHAAYFAHVDTADPVFALEHSRWADEWARAPLLDGYTLDVDDVQVDGNTATATLTVAWRTLAEDEAREARFPVRLTRGASGAWRYAGELWVDLETEHFLVRAQPGLEAAAESVRAALPDVYAHVTASLGYTPTAAMQIKLYDSVEALVANTLLSLPPIHGWNEPGEALKLFAGPGAAPESALAHEFTHFMEFEQAGTARSRLPWWLSEGLAVYVANEYAPNPAQTAQLDLVAQWSAEDRLAAWETLSVFETTPTELWRYVYPQGYAFVAFVTEVYGVEPRNAWLRAMSTEMDIAQATPAVLGLSFEALDAEFRDWLAQRR